MPGVQQRDYGRRIRWLEPDRAETAGLSIGRSLIGAREGQAIRRTDDNSARGRPCPKPIVGVEGTAWP